MRLCLFLFPTLLLGTSGGSFPIQVLETHTEQFQRGGALEIDGSSGELIIEGWSNSAVVLKLEKRTHRSYELAEHDEIKQELDRTLVTFRRTDDGRLRMETKHPSFHLWKRPLQGRSNLQLTYRLMVPRDTQLIIRHDVGLVKIREVIGQMDVNSRIGEVDVSLPETHDSRIYARAKVGNVESDFHPEVRRKLLAGAEFKDDSGRSARHVDLRVGVGAIKISKQKPEEI